MKKIRIEYDGKKATKNLELNKKQIGGKKMKNKTIFGILAVFLVAVLGVSSVMAFPFGFGLMSDNAEEDREIMTEMQEAIKNDDFETWKDLHLQMLTEENFERVVERQESMEKIRELREEMRDAMDEGNYETANEIQLEINELLPEEMSRMGMGKGMRGPFGVSNENGFAGNCPNLTE